jgi:hypothetical protein
VHIQGRRIVCCLAFMRGVRERKKGESKL